MLFSGTCFSGLDPARLQFFSLPWWWPSPVWRGARPVVEVGLYTFSQDTTFPVLSHPSDPDQSHLQYQPVSYIYKAYQSDNSIYQPDSYIYKAYQSDNSIYQPYQQIKSILVISNQSLRHCYCNNYCNDYFLFKDAE